MDEAEMSQILKEAFRLYGYEMAQAFNIPHALEPLLTGGDAVVTVHLNKNNTLTLTEYVADEECKTQLKACQKTVKEQKEEIEVLQATVENLESQTQEEPLIEMVVSSDVPIEEPKPRKRRKRS